MTTAHTPRLRQVGEVLIEQGLLTSAQLDEVLAAQKSSSERKLLGEVVVELGYCTDLQILEALARAYEVPFVRLTPALVDPAVARLLPTEFTQEHTVLPLFLVDDMLTVAVAEPSNVYLMEEISQRTGHAVQIVASPHTDILATAPAVEESRAADDGGAIDDILAEVVRSEDFSTSVSDSPDEFDDVSSDSPVVKLVQQLIVSAVRERASDMHFEPGDGTFRIRFRVDGRLYEKMRPPTPMASSVTARLKILAGLDIAERRLPQDGAIRLQVDNRPIDLRVSTLPNRFGEKVVLRILDTRNALIGLNQLGMDETMLESFTIQIHKPHGIVLVTGPTGSGKSTTLYAALAAIVSSESNISTVEDPIEYNLDGINQFQVHERIGFGFPAALRALLRQDPDVIMVGEIRDPETARIAVQAALTGHLVLSTLHTNDAASAATRLHNLGVESYLVSAALEGVLAQRLVRRICPSCKTEVEVPPHVQAALARLEVEAPTMFQGTGCVTCNQLGTRGRVGVYELFLPDDDIRDALGRGANVAKLRQLAKEAGMIPLQEAAIAKAQAGDTTYEEVLRVTVL
jgi:type IV pilus assembly protein PilB